MDKETSVVEDFLNLDKEETNPFKDTEEIIEQKEPEKEEEIPFHQNPKVLKFIDKQVSKRLAEFKPVETTNDKEDNSFKDVLESFTAIIGNDTPEKVNALNALQKSLVNLDERASQKAIDKLESIREQEVQQDLQAEQELNDAFDTIEDTYKVDITSNTSTARKTRQEFVSFVEKIAPKDRHGDVIDYPDMQSAWETFSEMKKSTQQPSRAKELASRSMTHSVESGTQPQSRANWDAADAFIESLKN